MLLLALIALLGAVESTPKEVALSVSTSATSASPLNTLPPGTSMLLQDLAEAGYDVRVYADLSDLYFDSPRRVVIAVIGPERVTLTQAQALVDYAEQAEYTAILLADEDPRETGSIALIERVGSLCPLGGRVPRPSTLINATLATLAYPSGQGYEVSAAPVYTAATIRGLLPPLSKPFAPPLPPISFEAGDSEVKALAFASTDPEDEEASWQPLAVVCRTSTTAFAMLGDSDVARNYLYNSSEAYRSFVLSVFRELAGGPGDGVTIAFIVSFYVGEGLSLATVIHPSYILSIAGQLYAAAEPEILDSLGGRVQLLLAAAALAASFTAAGHLLRGHSPRRRSRRGGGGRARPWRPGRKEVEVLCAALGPGAPGPAGVVCARLRGRSRFWFIAYSVIGWRRVYNKLLASRR